MYEFKQFACENIHFMSCKELPAFPKPLRRICFYTPLKSWSHFACMPGSCNMKQTSISACQILQDSAVDIFSFQSQRK